MWVGEIVDFTFLNLLDFKLQIFHTKIPWFHRIHLASGPDQPETADEFFSAYYINKTFYF